jgi:hypothetical protein
MRSEEEFLFNMNRFNVLISRARCKVLVIASQSLLDYIPQERALAPVAASMRAYAMELCPELVYEGSIEASTFQLRV